MTGLNLNFGSSVVKREAKSIDKVDKLLVNDGWEKTGSVLNGRVRYYEQSKVNITAIEGPIGTAIVPSGPVRGMVFGDVELFSRVSVIGAGSDNKNSTEKQMKGPNRTGNKSLI